MKKITILWGALAMVLAFGLTVVSCDDGGGDDSPGHDSALVGKWYESADEAAADSAGTEFLFHFKSDGTAGDTDGGTWSTSGGKLTLSAGGASVTFNYAISGTTVTFSGSPGGDLDGVYYKKTN